MTIQFPTRVVEKSFKSGETEYLLIREWDPTDPEQPRISLVSRTEGEEHVLYSSALSDRGPIDRHWALLKSWREKS